VQRCAPRPHRAGSGRAPSQPARLRHGSWVLPGSGCGQRKEEEKVLSVPRGRQAVGYRKTGPLGQPSRTAASRPGFARAAERFRRLSSGWREKWQGMEPGAGAGLQAWKRAKKGGSISIARLGGAVCRYGRGPDARAASAGRHSGCSSARAVRPRVRQRRQVWQVYRRGWLRRSRCAWVSSSSDPPGHEPGGARGRGFRGGGGLVIRAGMQAEQGRNIPRAAGNRQGRG